jgi:hypothetical protein
MPPLPGQRQKALYGCFSSSEPDSSFAVPRIAEPVTLTPVSTTVPTTLAVVDTTVPATESTVHPVPQSTISSAAAVRVDMAAALYHSHSIVAGGLDEMS